MRLPNRVILCFAVAAFFSIPLAFSGGFVFQVPKTDCVLAASPRCDKPLISAVLTRLNGRFQNSCSALPEPMDGPFSETSMASWKTLSSSSTFGFWLDLSPNAAEGSLRAIDLKSLLQWGYAKASTLNLNETSRAGVVESLVNRVVDQYPFVGFIEANGFFVWAKGDSVKVTVVQLDRMTRHPFLPYYLGVESKPIQGGVGQLSREGKNWKLSLPETFLAQPERLWLQASGEIP